MRRKKTTTKTTVNSVAVDPVQFTVIIVKNENWLKVVPITKLSTRQLSEAHLSQGQGLTLIPCVSDLNNPLLSFFCLFVCGCFSKCWCFYFENVQRRQLAKRRIQGLRWVSSAVYLDVEGLDRLKLYFMYYSHYFPMFYVVGS